MVTAKIMVATFQCPGCVNGEDTKCGKFKLHEIATGTSHDGGQRMVGGFRCINHETSAVTMGGGKVNMGLPVPFARVQYRDGAQDEVKTNIRMHLKPVDYGTYWDVFNVPVWALEKDGYLFVRTYSPRTDQSYVDVITGATVEMVRAYYPIVIDIGPIAERMQL
jgi:hypothetical protein